jgi:hypothetical protein
MILGFWVCFPVWGVFRGLLMVADGGVLGGGGVGGVGEVVVLIG